MREHWGHHLQTLNLHQNCNLRSLFCVQFVTTGQGVVWLLQVLLLWCTLKWKRNSTRQWCYLTVFFFSQWHATRKKLEFSQKELTLSFWTPLSLQVGSPFGEYGVKYTCYHAAPFTRPNRRPCSQARHPLEQKYLVYIHLV